ncbi:MAG: hypothetical protein ACOYLS_09640 [Polymorphobacter sp.]
MKLLLLALLLTTAPALVAKPFEPADLYALSMVTDPQVSPDDNRVLFDRATFDIATDTRQDETWLATITGNSVDKRLLIPAAVKAGAAAWSPDGTRIAYVGRVEAPPVKIGGMVEKPEGAAVHAALAERFLVSGFAA